MTDGSTEKADEDYIRDSIVNPWRVLTKGYDVTMPAYKNQLTEEQILQLVTYTKSLSVPTLPNGQVAPFVRPGPITDPGPGGRTNTTDDANKRVSAGNAQADMSENKR